jgi:hypothetical protein
MHGRESALLVGRTGPSPSGLRTPFRQHGGHGVRRLWPARRSRTEIGDPDSAALPKSFKSIRNVTLVADIDTGFDLLVDDPSQRRLANPMELSPIDSGEKLATSYSSHLEARRQAPMVGAAQGANITGSIFGGD